MFPSVDAVPGQKDSSGFWRGARGHVYVNGGHCGERCY